MCLFWHASALCWHVPQDLHPPLQSHMHAHLHEFLTHSSFPLPSLPLSLLCTTCHTALCGHSLNTLPTSSTCPASTAANLWLPALCTSPSSLGLHKATCTHAHQPHQIFPYHSASSTAHSPHTLAPFTSTPEFIHSSSPPYPPQPSLHPSTMPCLYHSSARAQQTHTP